MRLEESSMPLEIYCRIRQVFRRARSTEEFDLETFDRIFQRAELANGRFTYRGRKVDPGVIRNTPLLTVEGGRDDMFRTTRSRRRRSPR